MEFELCNFNVRSQARELQTHRRLDLKNHHLALLVFAVAVGLLLHQKHFATHSLPAQTHFASLRLIFPAEPVALSLP
jgi:hypothetical protein